LTSFPISLATTRKARLDNFGIELQNDPTATAYVIVYPGRTVNGPRVQDHFGRVIEYLVNSRGLDKSRIVTIDGPKKDQLQSNFGSLLKARPPNP
jgi:hypothetical protein